MEYERISSQKYSDDAKVASILLACPLQIRQHLHLWLTDTTTYEQLKDRIIQLEAVTTKWDSTNSLMPPTRTTGDEATPMEVDYIGKVGKGKKGLKGKGKEAKGKGQRKGERKVWQQRWQRCMEGHRERQELLGEEFSEERKDQQRKEERAQRVGPAMSVAKRAILLENAGRE